jgi:hypothetical protein
MLVRYAPYISSETGDPDISGLALRLETWRAEVPIQDPTSLPMPHVIILHLTYHLTDIFIHRPTYREESGMSARRCSDAALNIVNLVKVSSPTLEQPLTV